MFACVATPEKVNSLSFSLKRETQDSGVAGQGDSRAVDIGTRNPEPSS